MWSSSTSFETIMAHKRDLKSVTINSETAKLEYAGCILIETVHWFLFTLVHI